MTPRQNSKCIMLSSTGARKSRRTGKFKRRCSRQRVSKRRCSRQRISKRRIMKQFPLSHSKKIYSRFSRDKGRLNSMIRNAKKQQNNSWKKLRKVQLRNNSLFSKANNLTY